MRYARGSRRRGTRSDPSADRRPKPWASGRLARAPASPDRARRAHSKPQRPKPQRRLATRHSLLTANKKRSRTSSDSDFDLSASPGPAESLNQSYAHSGIPSDSFSSDDVLALYAHADFSWLVFAVLFLAPDLAMLAYLGGPRTGATVYNLAHTYALVALLALASFFLGSAVASALGLIWIAQPRPHAWLWPQISKAPSGNN
jgi:hypothetical protein